MFVNLTSCSIAWVSRLCQRIPQHSSHCFVSLLETSMKGIKKNPTSIQAIFAERWTPTYIALFMRNYLHTSHDALFACFCPIVYAHFRFESMFQTSIVTKYNSIATFSKKNERDWSYRTSVIAFLTEALCTVQVWERDENPGTSFAYFVTRVMRCEQGVFSTGAMVNDWSNTSFRITGSVLKTFQSLKHIPKAWTFVGNEHNRVLISKLERSWT